MSIDIGGMRKPYGGGHVTFDLTDLASRDPFQQFTAWFQDAANCQEIREANAMCLSTCGKEGIPSGRMVLLKKFGPQGFTFFTNYTSRKAEVIASRQVLEDKERELTEMYRQDKVEVPMPNWGGYRVVPTAIEFWQV